MGTIVTSSNLGVLLKHVNLEYVVECGWDHGWSLVIFTY
jgi:hypothetical protein